MLVIIEEVPIDPPILEVKRLPDDDRELLVLSVAIFKVLIVAFVAHRFVVVA